MWMTFDKNKKPLCNFAVKVVSVTKMFMDSEEEPVSYVQFYLDFGDKQNEEHKALKSVPLADLADYNWEALDNRCTYAPEFHGKVVKRYLNYYVRKDLTNNIPVNFCYRLKHVGMHYIKKQPVFCTGEQVLCDHSQLLDVQFEIGQTAQKLDINNEMTEHETIVETFELMALCPDAGQVLMAYKLGYFMYQAYDDMGRPPKHCIFLYGKSGIQKTTYSSLVLQTYNRKDGIKNPSRLNASIPAAIKMLLDKTADVVILDDLFPSDSNRVRQQMEETLIEITRYIADGTVPARIKGYKLLQDCPKCGVVFTGEYIIGQGSDAARILPIEMQKPDLSKLRYFQDNATHLSTFYYYFISWFINKYDEICDLIKKIWGTYEGINTQIHDRLRESHFFLCSSYLVFLQFSVEKKVLSEKNAEELMISFCNLLNDLVQKQNNRVMQQHDQKLDNIMDCQTILATLYERETFHLADDIKTFNSEEHDGLVYKNYNCLCLRGACIDKIVEEYFPQFSRKDFVQELINNNALKLVGAKRTVQIQGQRFYAIKLTALKQK